MSEACSYRGLDSPRGHCFPHFAACRNCSPSDEGVHIPAHTFVNNVHPSAVAIGTDQISRELKGRMPLFVRPTLRSDALVTSDHIARRGHGVAQNLATRIPLQLIDDPGRDDVLVAVSGVAAVNTHAVSHDLTLEGNG